MSATISNSILLHLCLSSPFVSIMSFFYRNLHYISIFDQISSLPWRSFPRFCSSFIDFGRHKPVIPIFFLLFYEHHFHFKSRGSKIKSNTLWIPLHEPDLLSESRRGYSRDKVFWHAECQVIKSLWGKERTRDRSIAHIANCISIFSKKNSEGKLNLESALYVSSRIQGE